MNESGLLLIDKQPGLSSHDVVAQARKILQTKQVGHCGTLDPMASGLMVLLINEATKLSQYILDGNKRYRVNFVFGLTTDTLDTTGQILTETKNRPDVDKAKYEISQLVGEFKWDIPLYSAKKVDGKKLYDYARENKAIELPQKLMSYWDLDLHHLDPYGGEVSLSCSKGSFIRSWVHELGQKLGCGATMSALRRCGSEPYSLEQSTSFEALKTHLASGKPLSEHTAFVPLNRSLPWLQTIKLQGPSLQLMKNGQISHDLKAYLITKVKPGRDEVFFAMTEANRPVSLIAFETGKGFSIRRVFHSNH